MKRNINKPKAGLFLLGSPRFRELGKNTENGTYLQRKENEVNNFIRNIEGSLDITYPGIIFEREQIGSVIRRFVSEEVDFIIAGFVSWAEDFAWIRFLRDLPDIPVILMSPVKSQASFNDTLDENDFVEFLCSGGLVGSLEASGSIQRFGDRKIHIVVDSMEGIYSEIMAFAEAARTKRILKASNFGLLASLNPLMWSTYVDPYNFFTRVGPELKFISYSAYVEEIRAISDQAVKNEVQSLKELYSVDSDVDEEKFVESVRASHAMGVLAQKLDINALVLNDVDPELFRLVGLRPGFYPERFQRDLSVVVPEADVGAGLITYILKLISGKHVNFIEPFYIEEDTGCFAAGHAGPNDHTDPLYRGNVRIARDVRFAKTNYKYAGAPFAWYRIPKGRKTMAHFSECNGSYKIICTLVDALEGEHFITSYSHALFKPLGDVKKLFGEIMQIGANQHFAVVDGDYTKQLEYYAMLMGFQYYKI